MRKIFIVLLLTLCSTLTSCYNCPKTTNETETDFYENNPVFNDDGSINFESFEYCYDIKPLNEGFKALNNSIISACWKEYRWGDGILGPSSYMMSGFMEISSEEAKQIENQFVFESRDIDFADGIHPEDTGFSDFNWGYSTDFKKFIIAGTWIGDVYYDTTNKLIYVYVGIK